MLINERNERNERIEYNKKYFGNEEAYIFEEYFIASVAKNEFAMKYVNKFNEIIEKEKIYLNEETLSPYKYNLKVILMESNGLIKNAKKVLLLMIYADKTKRFDIIETLIKKSHSRLYKMFLSGKVEINLEEENEYCYIRKWAIMLFIFSFMHVELDMHYEQFESIHVRLHVEYFPIKYAINEFKNNDNKNIIDKYKVKPNINLECIFAEIEKQFNQELSNILIKKGYTQHNIDKIILKEDYSIKEGVELLKIQDSLINAFTFIKYAIAYSKAFCVCNGNIIHDEISKEVINNVLGIVGGVESLFSLDKNKSEEMFIYLLFIAQLINTYNNLISETNNYILNLEDEKSKNKILQDAYEQEIVVINKEKDDLLRNIALKDEKIKELENTIKKYEANINKTNINIQNNIEEKRELIELRNLFFNIKKEDDDYIDEYSQEQLEDINLKVTFVGGNTKLLTRIKNVFPKFITIEGDDITRDLGYLKDMDYIFLHTNMTHSMYYKVIDIIRKNNIEFSFLNNNNIDILNNEIMDKLIKFKSSN